MKCLNDLKICFQNAILNNAKFIGIKVKMDDYEKAEIIINPNENFLKKIDYYINSYNDDLTLKSCNKIKIIDFSYGNTFEEIQIALGDKYDNL